MPEAARHLLLVRHGQSVWNAEDRWQGQADPPLSELGEAQAREAARRMAERGFSLVVASDLQRARRTAEILAAAVGMGVRLEAGLREIDVGEWEGLTRAEIKARWPRELTDWSQGRRESPLGGETRSHLAERARSTLTRLAAEAGAGERILVVTHGALIRGLDRALGVPSETMPNLGGRWYQADGNGALVPGAVVSLADPEDTTLSRNP
jgi:broad specificity phosphatase PhoE